jgi:DNA-binding response OmpR family regulator
MSNALCPKCGHNFEADAPISRDGWHLDPAAGRVVYHGAIVCERATFARILHTLAAAAPAIVAGEALLNRVSGSENSNVLASTISQMKRAWPETVPWPVESVHGRGYRWVGGS